MTVLYVDVSHHDWSRHGGQLDWAKVRSTTSPVMVARATYGDPAGFNPDSRYFGSMASAAKAEGFLVGAYHNLIRGDQASINRQVDYLRREMDKAGATWAMLDVERYDELLTRNLHPRISDAQRFCDRWRAVDRRVLTVYLPRWIWDGHMGRPDLRVLGFPLVASNYGSNPDGSPSAVYNARGGDGGTGWNAYGGVTPTVWQYGSNIDCPGASGATDVNAYRGSLAELRSLLTGQPEEDTVTPAEFLKILRDPAVAAEMSRLPWAFQPAELDGKKNAHAIVLQDVPRSLAGLTTSLAGVAGRVDLGAEEVQAVATALAPAIVAQLPKSGAVTAEQLEAALRTVLGSVDNAPQAG